MLRVVSLVALSVFAAAVEALVAAAVLAEVLGGTGFSGLSGFSGMSGISGISGISGFSGFSGLSGPSGLLGLQVVAVERKRADIAIFVLLLLVETLLELTVLLETVFLGHQAFFGLGLHHTAFAAEGLHLTVEHLVFAEFALQRAVVQGYLDAGLQADLLEALLTIRQDPCIAAHELVFQPLADHAIGAEQVGCRDTLAVGRVAHEDSLVFRLLEVFEVLLLNGDVAGQSGSLGIDAGRVDSLHVDVVAVDVMVERALLRVVVIYLVEEVGIEVGPFLEGILLAEEARSHVACDEGRLDEQGAAAAHRVDEVGLALPSGHHDHAGGQHLVERCLYRLLPVATPVERLAAGVKAECAVVLGDMYMQTEVGVGHGDVGALAGAFAKLVDDGVFHLVGHKLRVAEVIGEYDGIDRERVVDVEILAPVYLFDSLVDLIGTPGFEVVDRFQNLDGRMQCEVGTVHHFFVTSKRHHASTYLYVVGTQLGQFFRQHRFQSHERFGDEVEFLVH